VEGRKERKRKRGENKTGKKREYTSMPSVAWERLGGKAETLC
jgi:hypothetical protein